MSSLYPLRFEPVLKRYLWGGRRLHTILGKPLPAGDDYAESWEISDHPAGQSVVTAGSLKGATLGELVANHGPALLGKHASQAAAQGRFPLLFKLLDAQKVLSVQVHPTDAAAAQLTPPDLGKTEAWVVLHAEPGSVVYAGIKRGFDRATVERELLSGTVELCLNKFEPQAGDCLFIPAGVVHALGAGLVIAEIQQASDTTFRLYDWKRVGPDGQPRPLHIQQSLAAIDFAHGPVQPQKPTVVPHADGTAQIEQLVSCDKFVLERWTISGPTKIGGDDRCYLLCAIDGELSISNDPSQKPLARGQSALLPATSPALLTPRREATVLVASLPG
ncbi:Putative mannose-6-phosphate isomerase YvyI [Anatilimnocola aggregata]|uniref:Phosphohexomutase n=1 Tax=Anatilimnocola aggregata TaxID=2528021 RepID=A0A517YBU2_9BACT|nr:type I phosphomannose isomerase catalytic subunit [Anatilimnocola aggregata]QDU27723.1 Putative mannose-6-phosphate isomerase YvyI [Anatilimnocola aggregata]